jgi:hypothetical protein
MAKKTKRRVFLETSGVIYELHGHSLMRAAVSNATSGGRIEVSNFIRMEYLRGVILNLIELYFLIQASDSVTDALIDWSQKVRQERKLKIVLMTIGTWLVDQEDWQAKEKSLRRLGDQIVRFAYAFDDVFARRARDHLSCELGRVFFPRRTFREVALLNFYDRFRRIQRGVPGCRLCDFRDRQQRSLPARRIDLYSEARRQEFRSYKGYVAQAERLEEAAATSEAAPKCRWCERVGDSIIALHSPPKAVLVTADRAFIPFGQILNRETRLLPSLAQLKRQLSAQNEGGERH